MQLPTPVTSRSQLPDDGRHGRHGRHRWPRASRFAIPVAVVVLLAAGVVVGLRLSQQSPSTPNQAPVPTSNAPGALEWAPPTLSHPTTISLSAKNRSLDLNPARDYRLVMPKKPLTVKGGLSITGGHNVVLVGGTLLVPSVTQAPDPQDRRGVYLKGQTGVVHIEGLQIGGDLSEGFDLDERLGATVQIENVDVATVHGSRDTNHADVIQTWAGPAKLLVDGLRASSDYQGLFLLPNQHWTDGPAPQVFDIRRSVITLSDGAGYGVWVPDSAPWMHADGLTIVTSKTDRGKVLWPASQLGQVKVASTTSTTGEPPGGTPGLQYQTPGYREGVGS
jgi:hypothetical protein